MRKHTLKEWIIASRPWSFPASAMPVVVTLSWLLWNDEHILWFTGILAIIDMVLFQAAGNVWSDYFDFKHGVDSKDTFGSKTITSGTFSPKEMYKFGIALLITSIVLGIIVMAIWINNFECFHNSNIYDIIFIVLIGILGTLMATIYPFLKYNALGDIAIFICYALIPVIGTTLIATNKILFDSLFIAVPVGLITVAILHANNARDISTDSRAKIKTFAIVLGKKHSIYLYYAEIIIPFIWVIVCSITGVFPIWSLISLLAVFSAIRDIRMMSGYLKKNNSAIATLDEQTAKLQLLFSLLLALSFAAGSLLS